MWPMVRLVSVLAQRLEASRARWIGRRLNLRFGNPSPLAGEGGPKGQMRGQAVMRPSPSNPPGHAVRPLSRREAAPPSLRYGPWVTGVARGYHDVLLSAPPARARLLSKTSWKPKARRERSGRGRAHGRRKTPALDGLCAPTLAGCLDGEHASGTCGPADREPLPPLRGQGGCFCSPDIVQQDAAYFFCFIRIHVIVLAWVGI